MAAYLVGPESPATDPGPALLAWHWFDTEAPDGDRTQFLDEAVTLAGLGVTVGSKVEELYREVRALRIYEGASEVQRLVIARDLLK